jgi:hypothetical protein
MASHNGFAVPVMLIASSLVVASASFAQQAAPQQATPQQTAPWPVKNKLVGKDGDKAEDVSGMACTTTSGFPRLCLAIDDEVQAAQIVILNEGQMIAGSTIPLIEDKHDGKALELDGEAVAFADGFFYVVGSHGHPRDADHKLHPLRDAETIAAEIKAASKVIRIKLDPAAVDAEGKLKEGTTPEIAVSDRLRVKLQEWPQLQPHVDRRLDENGLTIEGAAVKNDRLYVGMRGPLMNGDRDAAPIYSASLMSLFEGAHADPQLVELRLGEAGRGIRDLVAYEKGFLVLAGPATEVEGDYAVFYWDGATTQGEPLGTLARFADKKGRQVRPEGIVPLDATGDVLRLLVLFDRGEEGEPRPLVVRKPAG